MTQVWLHEGLQVLPGGRLQRASGHTAQLLRSGRAEAAGQSGSDAGKWAGRGEVGLRVTGELAGDHQGTLRVSVPQVWLLPSLALITLTSSTSSIKLVTDLTVIIFTNISCQN